MITHPTLTGILLHSDQELASLLGAGILCRNTIHEWPLSCVQKVTLDNGKQLIYKSQLPQQGLLSMSERNHARAPTDGGLGFLR